MKAEKKGTPMLEQYWRLKEEQPGALLLFRLGDFYELFEQDAEIAAPILDLQLTSRDGRVPMCGVPHHALGQYARRLLEGGYTVAVAEQMEDPALARGLVDRQIVRVLTPGTVIPEDGAGNPRLGMWYRHRQGAVAVVAELSTGAVHIAEGSARSQDRQQLEHLWAVWQPDEYLSNVDEPWMTGAVRVDAGPYLRRMDPLHLERMLTEKMGLEGLRRWGLEGRVAVQEALLALWRYLESLQRRTPAHMRDLRIHPLAGEMVLGAQALAQLDISQGPYSLLHRLDHCTTPMGSRRLKEWLEHPLTDLAMVRRRSGAVGYWVDHALERGVVREHLKASGDFGRRVARVVMGTGRPRDVAGIQAALSVVPAIWEAVHETGIWSCPVEEAHQRAALLAARLAVMADPVPARWEESPLIRAGVDAAIDQSRDLLQDQRQALVQLEERERERSQIKSLRVGYHRSFGYYLEVTRSQAKTVPEDWHRRQSTTHTERFVSDSLRSLEEEIQQAEEQLRSEERRWAENLQAWVQEEAGWLSEVAAWLAEVDVLSTLAEAAVKYRYQPPVLGAASGVDVRGLRHPVLEGLLDDYVASDLDLSDAHSALIITGPNMGGKSTFMRAMAVNVIMAQIGGWVAASGFAIPVFDAVLTRIGADDDLVRGQSTFMVEMEEVAAILHQAHPASLVLLDELGRGTSTYDGLAIAHAVIERLAMPDGPLTLFATHYHELTSLAEENPRIQNLTVEVLEGPHGPVFTHRIIHGRASQSYGVAVARQAGLPAAVLRRAESHLRHWEGHQDTAPEKPQDAQITFYAPDPASGVLAEALKTLNVDDLSPREAWLWIADWQGRLRKGADS